MLSRAMLDELENAFEGQSVQGRHRLAGHHASFDDPFEGLGLVEDDVHRVVVGAGILAADGAGQLVERYGLLGRQPTSTIDIWNNSSGSATGSRWSTVQWYAGWPRSTSSRHIARPPA